MIKFRRNFDRKIYSDEFGNRVLNFINAFIAYSRVMIVLIDQFKIFSKIFTISSSVIYSNKSNHLERKGRIEIYLNIFFIIYLLILTIDN